MPFGYHGRYFLIDVTHPTRVERPDLSDAILRRTLGGAGLGAHLLLEHGRPQDDACDPAQPLIFAFSPLVGSPLTTSAKFAVVGKSPLTGRINDALAGSGFAIAGKHTGADAFVIVGRVPALSVLVIDDGAVRVEPADDLAGLACADAEEKVRSRLGPGFRIASIGPAGERFVRYATISHDGRHAGRGGSGAVLGSKNIKAIAVRGNKRVEWADPKALVEISRDLSTRSFGPATEKYRELGTAANMLMFNRFGTLPTRNFQTGTFEHAVNLSPEEMKVAHGKARASCVACTIGCEHIYGVNGGQTRVEYESLFALGSLCGVGNSAKVLRAVQRCDELGLDTISTGGTIAFAMECVERGLIDERWLTFGDGDAMLRAIELIGAREGLGATLAEGSRRAAEQIGQGSLAFAPQVKGLEIPGYEPRALQTMALGFAVGSRGADHNRSGAYEADFSDAVDRRDATLASVRHAIETEDKAALMDSLILCKFLRGVFSDFHVEAAVMLRAVTGWDATADELRATAKQIVQSKREFNMRAGWTPSEDTLPDRFLNTPLPNDPAAVLTRERLTELVNEYHRQRGWRMV
ncbi:MAG TPA: aldehyde ferredoxin oxidoreductase family protein [Vicinamibacterales bacterium]|nr:aldehyde ferredoxin oxidoreductase family protein [Vicinamibacterales bacterium]